MDISARLALIGKVGLVFGADDTFLSFPLLQPISFPASTLDFNQALSDVETMASLMEFSRTVSTCPLGPVFQEQGDAYLWERYDDWLNGMHLAQTRLSPADEVAYGQVKDFLSSIDPSTGLPADSPVYVAYKQCRDSYMTALQALRVAKLTPGGDPAGAAASQAQLDQALKDAESAWEGRGRKAEVEAALAARARFDAQDPENVWGDWRSRYQPEVDQLSDPASGTSFAPSSFSPSNVSDQSWTRLTMDASEVKTLIPKAPTSLQSLAAGAGGSDILSISLDVRSVSVVRPWFDSRVFSARFWKFGGDETLSDGETPPEGEWPAYVVAVVFARNIQVTSAAQPSAAPTPVRVFPPIRFPIDRPVANPIVRAPPSPPGLPARRLMVRPMMAMRGIGATALEIARAPTAVATLPVAAAPHPILAAGPLRVSPLMRMNMASFTVPPPPPSGSPAPAPTTTSTTDGEVSVLALICRPLPRSPDPDPALAW